MSLARSTEIRPEEDEELYALKSIIKTHVRSKEYLEEMRNEIYTMSHLRHSNIARVYEAYERKRHIYLVMEYCRGGDLLGREPNEAEAACIIRKVLQAVEYLHAHNVVHRDLKLENIMFDRPTKDAEIKIIDFGLATKYLSDDHKHMTDRVGTLYSMAPQVLQGVLHDSKCDLWSIGVITYILLSGYQPFWGPPREMSWEKRRKIMMDRILKCDYMRMTGPVWAQVSPEAKAFVKSLLQCDPEKRPTATEALQSPWMKKTKDLKVEFKFPHHKAYCEAMDLKRHARRVLAEKLTTAEIVELKNLLEEMDKDQDGSICLPDFCTALSKTRLSQSDIESLVPQAAKPDVCVSVDYVTLMNNVLEAKSRRDSERLATALSSVDSEETGKITKDQLYTTLRDVLPDEMMIAVLDSVDEDEGGISIQQVLDVADKEHIDAINTLLTPSKDFGREDSMESSLLTPKDVVIPGGQNNETERPRYFYDSTADLLRKCDA